MKLQKVTAFGTVFTPLEDYEVLLSPTAGNISSHDSTLEINAAEPQRQENKKNLGLASCETDSRARQGTGDLGKVDLAREEKIDDDTKNINIEIIRTSTQHPFGFSIGPLGSLQGDADDRELVVTNVACGGLAGVFGVKLFDKILEINGESAAGHCLEDLNRIISNALKLSLGICRSRVKKQDERRQNEEKSWAPPSGTKIPYPSQAAFKSAYDRLSAVERYHDGLGMHQDDLGILKRAIHRLEQEIIENTRSVPDAQLAYTISSLNVHFAIASSNKAVDNNPLPTLKKITLEEKQKNAAFKFMGMNENAICERNAFVKISESGLGDRVDGFYFYHRITINEETAKKNTRPFDIKTSPVYKNKYILMGNKLDAKQPKKNTARIERNKKLIWCIKVRDQHGNTCFPYKFLPNKAGKEHPHWSEVEKGQWKSIHNRFNPPPRVEMVGDLKDLGRSVPKTIKGVKVEAYTLAGDTIGFVDIDSELSIKRQFIDRRPDIFDDPDEFMLLSKSRRIAVAILPRTEAECGPKELPLTIGESVNIICPCTAEMDNGKPLLCENSSGKQGLVHQTYILSSLFADAEGDHICPDEPLKLSLLAAIRMGAVNKLQYSVLFRRKITLFVMTRANTKSDWTKTPLELAINDTTSEYLGRKLNRLLLGLKNNQQCSVLLVKRKNTQDLKLPNEDQVIVSLLETKQSNTGTPSSSHVELSDQRLIVPHIELSDIGLEDGGYLYLRRGKDEVRISEAQKSNDKKSRKPRYSPNMPSFWRNFRARQDIFIAEYVGGE